MYSTTPVWAAAGLVIGLASVSSLRAQSEPIVTTPLEIMLGGTTLRYTVQAGRIDIVNSETNEIHGRMFFVAYRLPSHDARRPVMFMWNGGPGSPSNTLEFESVGPKRLQDGRLLDNQETILPVADLVFVDAIGTGFSRVTKAEYEAEFYNTLGDIAAFTEFVRAWRLQFDAVDAPIFLAGESFGSARAAGVAAELEKRHITVGGVALISGSLGVERTLPRELSTALLVPEWAGIALFHEKGAMDLGRDTAAAKSAARAWAVSTYAPALARVAALSDTERDAIVRELSHFTGIPAAKINRQTLVITPREFRAELLPDRGLTLPLFDMRRTEPIAYTAQETASMEQSLRHDIGYRTTMPYVGLGAELASGYYPTGVANPDDVPKSVNERWNYFAPGTPAEERAAQTREAIRVGGGPPGVSLPWTERAFALNPKLRVLVATGRYDAGTCLVVQETVQRLAEPLRSAFTARCYPGGHMMYKDAEARRQFSADLEQLVTSARTRQ